MQIRQEIDSRCLESNEQCSSMVTFDQNSYTASKIFWKSLLLVTVFFITRIFTNRYAGGFAYLIKMNQISAFQLRFESKHNYHFTLQKCFFLFLSHLFIYLFFIYFYFFVMQTFITHIIHIGSAVLSAPWNWTGLCSPLKWNVPKSCSQALWDSLSNVPTENWLWAMFKKNEWC